MLVFLDVFSEILVGPAGANAALRTATLLSVFPSVDRFLLFGRNLLQQSSGEAVGGYDSDVFKWRNGANNSLAPDESDEVALEFLHKHAGDLSRAQFHMTSQVSGGAGAKRGWKRTESGCFSCLWSGLSRD